MQSEQPAASALGVYATTTDEAKALVPRAIPAVISSPFWMFILVRRRQPPREYGSPSSCAQADAGISGRPGLAAPGDHLGVGASIRLGLGISGC